MVICCAHNVIVAKNLTFLHFGINLDRTIYRQNHACILHRAIPNALREPWPDLTANRHALEDFPAAALLGYPLHLHRGSFVTGNVQRSLLPLPSAPVLSLCLCLIYTNSINSEALSQWGDRFGFCCTSIPHLLTGLSKASLSRTV